MKRSRRRSSSLSRTQDLSRLLDPSYLPHSSSSASSSPVSVHAWVDDHGDLHDPDYRDFPILVAPATHRPAWEGAPNNDPDDDDAAPLTTSRPVTPREKRRARYNAEYAAFASQPSYASNSTYASSTSHAYDRDHSEAAPPPSPRRRKLRALSPRRSSCALERASEHEDAVEDERSWFEEPETEEPKEEYVPSRQQSDWTPTCSEQIRRHWHAFTLGVRFSLFRAQRRIHRRLSAT
ncbi:hypothetical protein K488DRAFT_86767 [Vararia minispora EC-137]|uniref:Uncharacterized protein n=1 Tax=Vararia minispora EC-137 TaxID=1314806 RepID=A0ACB8QIB6_9AGAM|nr:hypothetical protein K488DRAFT_86767 [Vararia minispora EC-137]